MPHTVYIFNILVMWAVGVTSICIMAFDSPQLTKLGFQFNPQAKSWSLENRQLRLSGRQGYPKR